MHRGHEPIRSLRFGFSDSPRGTHLGTGQLFVLLPLGHLDGRQVGYRGDQEVHEDVLAVGGGVHQSAERGGQVVREQVVVVPGEQTLCCVTS